MSGAIRETRPDVVMGSSIAQEVGGSLVLGPYSRDVIVQRIGALVTTTLDKGPVAVTTSPNVGSMSLTVAKGAAKNVFVKNVYNAPGAADGSQKGVYVLTKGNTLTITGALVADSSGDYTLFAEIIPMPLHVDGDTVNEG